MGPPARRASRSDARRRLDPRLWPGGGGCGGSCSRRASAPSLWLPVLLPAADAAGALPLSVRRPPLALGVEAGAVPAVAVALGREAGRRRPVDVGPRVTVVGPGAVPGAGAGTEVAAGAGTRVGARPRLEAEVGAGVRLGPRVLVAGAPAAPLGAGKGQGSRDPRGARGQDPVRRLGARLAQAPAAGHVVVRPGPDVPPALGEAPRAGSRAPARRPSRDGQAGGRRRPEGRPGAEVRPAPPAAPPRGHTDDRAAVREVRIQGRPTAAVLGVHA